MPLFACGDINLTVPGVEDSHQQLRRRSKAEESDAHTRFHSCDSHTAKPNNARTEQRCGISRRKLLRQLEEKVSASSREFGVATVVRVTRVPRLITQILAIRAAETACAINTAYPGDAYTLARSKP